MSQHEALDLVALLYEVRRREREDHTRDPNVYWVSDLVRCPLKRVYELKYPDLVAGGVFTPVFVLGELVHRGLEGLLVEVYGDRAQVEVEASREVTLPDGRVVRVDGRIDALLTLDDRRVGVEIKTARGDMGLPQEHHVDQVRIYNWLLDLDYSVLIYVTPDRVTQYVVEDRADEREVVERITSTQYPRYPWECGYCSFSVLCPYKKPEARR